ncbi:response regulator [Ancylomarina longa]|uniref:DNA-binding response regulator n=1 Tax=Ancylomarina longa TaxID=2487017 RepID=A0A434AUU5_9BACT|nr:response regulator transcription factor [Ancylomarina longa]RUT78212.1 DNA-binding response regulator [Ancylomarina longa]
MTTCKVIIADDHQIIVDGIKAMLNQIPNIEIIGEARDGQEAVNIIFDLRPNLVILDISMPKLSGIEVAKRIRKENTKIKILVLTQHENREYVMQMLRAGANGYLLKNCKKPELVEAIDTVMRGESYLGNRISKVMINSIIDKSTKAEKEETKVHFTKREKEIIRLIATDLSNQEIADQLSISLRTVETHRRNVMQKLNVNTVVALVRYAVKHKIITIE